MAEIREIPEDVAIEIEALSNTGMELLGLPAGSTPEAIIAAITQFVRTRKAAHSGLPDEQIYALGALLGCQYVLGLQWHWGSVVRDHDEENGAIGVLNHDNSLFNNPIGWIGKIMESEGGVPFMLSYNMIVANQAPVFDPDSATGLY
jgi:hypothetical protein